jgi:hypothetical protein
MYLMRASILHAATMAVLGQMGHLLGGMIGRSSDKSVEPPHSAKLLGSKVADMPSPFQWTLSDRNQLASVSSPDGKDQIYDGVRDPAGDKEQDCPYQIVDLPPEIGGSLLHRLRSPEEEGSQE